MQKKNSIILMFIVLITMFINVNSVTAKIKCTYSRTIKTNTYPNITAESFYLSVDKKSKKLSLADKVNECKKNKYYDYAKKICDKIKNGEVSYNVVLKTSNCSNTYTVLGLGSDDGCPKKICLDKYITKNKKNSTNSSTNNKNNSTNAKTEAGTAKFDTDTQKNNNNDNVTDTDNVNDDGNTNKADNSTEKEDEVAKSLEFANTQGCSLWGSLLLTFKMILTFIKWFIGVGLVILTMMDFAKVVMSSDPGEALSKAKKKLSTRIIILILVFLVPSILDLLISDILEVETCISAIQ